MRRTHVAGGLVLVLLAGFSSTAWAEAKAPPTKVEFVVDGATEKEQGQIKDALMKNEGVGSVEFGEEGKVTVTVKPEKSLDLAALNKAVEGIETDPEGAGVFLDAHSITPSGETEIVFDGIDTDEENDTLAKVINLWTGFAATPKKGMQGTFSLKAKGSNPTSLAKIFDLAGFLATEENGGGVTLTNAVWSAAKAAGAGHA